MLSLTCKFLLFLVAIAACPGPCVAAILDHLPSRLEMVSRINVYWGESIADTDTTTEYMALYFKFSGKSADQTFKELESLLGKAQDIDLYCQNGDVNLTFFFEYTSNSRPRVYEYTYTFRMSEKKVRRVLINETVNTKIVRFGSAK